MSLKFNSNHYFNNILTCSIKLFKYIIGEIKTGLILVGEKISQHQKIGHFSLTKFYTSKISRKTLLTPLKFYFKNRQLVNGQVNWLIKINVSVEVTNKTFHRWFFTYKVTFGAFVYLCIFALKEIPQFNNFNRFSLISLKKFEF